MGHQSVILRQENISTAKMIYYRHLKKDFPASETKPFSAISKAMRCEKYKVFGAYANERLVGYAFVFISNKDGKVISLLDYFAVVEGMRGKGLGKEILKNLSPDRLGFDNVLIESESLSGAEDKEDRDIRQRRIRFYESCGAINSGVKAFLYEVEYDILVFYRCGMSVTEETVYEMTESLYEDMYGNLPWYPDLAKVYRNGKGN